MDNGTLADRQRTSQRGFYEHVIAGGPESRVERPGGGLLAAVCPALPERSLPNAVLYESPDEVDESLDPLAAIYAEAGVHAWTVWVRPGHAALAQRLESVGHCYDGWPLLMGASLTDLDLESAPPSDFDPDDEPSFAEVGRVNDIAYGLDREFERLLAEVRDPASRLWVARLQDTPAAAVLIRQQDADAYVGLVATIPAARGRGWAAALLRRGLRAALARGAETTTLEASAMGEGLYRRLGYRSLGRFGLWERREIDVPA